MIRNISFRSVPFQRFQRGATLVEAMVALFVFSIGALGIAALQVSALVRSDDVKQRSVAIWKAQELVERMKATSSILGPNGTTDYPTGLMQLYIDDIGSDKVAPIGLSATSGGFSCPAAAVTRCDDVSSTDAKACDIEDLVAFDVWSTLCDPVSGATLAGDIPDDPGLNKLKDLDVALLRDGSGQMRLYLEWQNRSAEQNEALKDGSGTPKKLKTDLCGDEVEVDANVSVYCLRFI